ncbi:MAG: hypothetical protein IKH58_09775 [Bacteroidales bacterium]|nr:hypothetical protein [Bacteroidales bacterium]MBR3540831.1 hypothetical protein [Bacteroidales bacterium]
MKKTLALTSLFLSLALASCYQNSDEELSVNNKVVTFNLELDGVEQTSMTRAIKEPGNLLVIDKLGDKVTTSIKNSLAAFGMPLEYGTHDIYFVAADQIWSSFSTADLTVTWPTDRTALSYTWAYHLSIEVDENTSVEDITLPLVISNVQLKTLDKIPAEVSKMAVEAPGLSKVFDLKTMSGVEYDSDYNFSIDVSKYAGTKTFSVNLFTFVPASGYVGDVVLTALGSNNNEIAAKTFEQVPVQAGYISLYSGYFFSDGVSFPLSYSDDWTGTNNYGY